MAHIQTGHGSEGQTDWSAVWPRVRERLRRELGQAVFEAWIAPLTLEFSTDEELRIGAAKPFVRNWVSNHYTARIERAFRAENVHPELTTIVLATSAVAVVEPKRVAASLTEESEPEEELKPRPLWDRVLHPAQTFDTFVGGTSNDFLVKATRAFVENDDARDHILLIHGGFGFGKTHLLNAMALRFRDRGKRVLFLRAEDFMRHFLGAIYRKDTLTFKEELRTAGVLILDDLQHISNSTATAAEFLYTMNALVDLRRPVLIAADRPPQQIEKLPADVRSALTSGLILEVEKPDAATRLDILKSRRAEFVRHRPLVEISDDMLARIAELESASPREFLGILMKLATYSDLVKKPVTMEMVEEAINARQAPGAKVSIEDIQRKIADFYRLEVRDFHGPTRARRVARPRQVAMYLSRNLTTRSLPEIGRRFGGRDHTTVLHACRRIEALFLEDPTFKQEVDFLRQTLTRRLQN